MRIPAAEDLLLIRCFAGAEKGYPTPDQPEDRDAADNEEETGKQYLPVSELG